MKYKLVVYDTLKRGHHNHDLIREADFLGEVAIEPGWGLYVQGLPYLIQHKDGTGCYAELYEVTEQQLAACDRLEGHPNFYRRVELFYIDLDTKHKEKAFCYIYPKEEKKRDPRFIRRF